MKATIILEGAASGPDSKYLQIRCREGFRKLIDRCEFRRSPALKASGGRGQAFKDFTREHRRSAADECVFLLVDSEDPIGDVEAPWAHLKERDNWDKPASATDEQALLMTTCMETWIVADVEALRAHYGAELSENGLPSLTDLESKHRHAVQDSLVHASRKCRNKYEKGKRSFDILSRLNPDELEKHLPSFKRCRRILNAKLK